MRKCFVYIICGVLVGANVNGSSVRIVGMGGVHIAIEDIESEMLENPAEWMRFNKPVILFDALKGNQSYDYGLRYIETLDNEYLIPPRYYEYKRELKGLFLYPIRKTGILGGGYTDYVSSYARWAWDYYYHLNDEGEYEKGLFKKAHCTQDIRREILLCGAIKVSSINIGVMSRFYINSIQVRNNMSKCEDIECDAILYSHSDTGTISHHDHTFGLMTDAIQNTHLAIALEISSQRLCQYDNDSYWRNPAYIDFKLDVRRKVFKWLDIGTKIEYHWTYKWGNHGIAIPLGIAIYPDTQTIIGVDFHNIYNMLESPIQLPKIVVGGERLIGKLALRCGLEICHGVTIWKDYSFDPTVGIGYCLTDKLHFDFVTEPINWYLHGLAVQYKF